MNNRNNQKKEVTSITRTDSWSPKVIKQTIRDEVKHHQRRKQRRKAITERTDQSPKVINNNNKTMKRTESKS